jgi:quinohemoprotein ethanol dehydrogenase
MRLALAALLLVAAWPSLGSDTAARETGYLDSSDGRDWPSPGRTYGEQHYSPLDEINAGKVGQLGLAWSLDLPVGNSVTQPIAVEGVLYFASGFSVVHAVDAATGKVLWAYDPKVLEMAGDRLRAAWGSRGIAWCDGSIYVATFDGRLIAIDAKTGKQQWSAQTTAKDSGLYITGAPRAFDGKVIIGNAGADTAAVRGYVTAYDARSGTQLWRFHTVPGNPASGFESPAMEMAAKTWHGEWWKHGGGGTVWNAITYDAETRTVLLGTGNGAPWNRKVRSEGKGDNLFLSSIVALDADSGAYKWHYQTNPGDSWDYNAAMDIQLAELTIGGKPRKVLLTAPKNGFFYVIDRTNGQLVSAEPFTKVTWAKSIDLKTGRPVEAANVRYENGPFLLAPSPVGAHSWLPMAFSPKTGLAYIPVIEMEATLTDGYLDVAKWRRPDFKAIDGGVGFLVERPSGESASSLLAWDPVAQKQVWRVPTPTNVNGGVMAAAGNLVFQGTIDGRFSAYDALNGALLWSFDAKAPIMGPPISYAVNGRQYVTVITGAGTSLVLQGERFEKYNIGYREQARRVLTFTIGGKAALPEVAPYKFEPVTDPGYRPDRVTEARGFAVYSQTCIMCHGRDVYAAGNAPDLRASPMILSKESFAEVVTNGALQLQGMPSFADLTGQQVEDIRQYLRKRADDAVHGKPPE